MKKLLTIFMTLAMCFAFVPYLGGADYSADAATFSLNAPKYVKVGFDPGFGTLSVLKVGVPIPKENELLEDNGDSMHLQIDWKLVGDDISDDWKYEPCWDELKSKVDYRRWEIIDDDITYYREQDDEGNQVEYDEYLFLFDGRDDIAWYEDETGFKEIIPEKVLKSYEVADEVWEGIDFNKYGVEVRARYVYDKEILTEDYNYEHERVCSPWSDVVSYGNYAKDFEKFDNLLVNPDFEEGIAGWKNPDGAWGVKINESGYYAQHGRFLAWPLRTDKTDQEDGAYTYMYQDIPLNDSDAGRTFVMNALVCNYDQGDCDMGRIRVKFLDSSSKSIKSFTQDQRNPNWNSQTIIAEIPQGAVKARVMLYGYRYVGYDIDAYYDYTSAYISDKKIQPVTIKEADSRRMALAGDTLKLVATNGETSDPAQYSWSSSYNLAATVDANGVVTMHTDAEQGVAIYAKDSNGVTGTYWINSPESLGRIIVSPGAVAYTGKARKVEPQVFNGNDRLLTEGSDYKVEYADNVNVGTATVTVTGLGAFEGDVLSGTYEIQPADLSKFTVKLASSSAVYTGLNIKPGVTVKNSAGVKLASGTDYKVTYSNNKKVGKAKVTVTGIGNYTGKISKTFKINPKGTAISSVTAQKKGFTVKYKKQATQTTGYQVRYATKSSMGGAKTVTVKSNKTLSAKVSKLKGGKKYWVQVRTYKTVSGTKYYSAWSKSKTVTTKK